VLMRVLTRKQSDPTHVCQGHVVR